VLLDDAQATFALVLGYYPFSFLLSKAEMNGK